MVKKMREKTAKMMGLALPGIVIGGFSEYLAENTSSDRLKRHPADGEIMINCFGLWGGVYRAHGFQERLVSC